MAEQVLELGADGTFDVDATAPVSAPDSDDDELHAQGHTQAAAASTEPKYVRDARDASTRASALAREAQRKSERMAARSASTAEAEKRANKEAEKENAQRKLRLQAAKVARAEAKIDKANAASCARLELLRASAAPAPAQPWTCVQCGLAGMRACGLAGMRACALSACGLEQALS